MSSSLWQKLAGQREIFEKQLNRWVEERRSKGQALNSEEEAMVREAQARHENLSAQSYTGGGRILPDPMDYRSGSWLAKLATASAAGIMSRRV